MKEERGDRNKGRVLTKVEDKRGVFTKVEDERRDRNKDIED